MPPRQTGGLAEVPYTVPAGNVTFPQEWQFVTEWFADGDPRPVDLQLDTYFLPLDGLVVSNPGFPTGQRPVFSAGSTLVTSPAGSTIVVRIELGQGPNARTLYCDLKSGRFALGSQERVRVSVARWKTSEPLTGNIRVQAGISETDGSGEYLTYTMVSTSIVAAASLTVYWPPGAAWWDWYSNGDFFAVQYSPDLGYVARYANVSPPVYVPPSSPLPILSSGVTLTNDGAIDSPITIVVWVR